MEKQLCIILNLLCFSAMLGMDLKKENNKILIIDTQGHQRYNYQTLDTMLHAAGFKPDYKNLYAMLENPTIEGYSSVVFMPSMSFFQHMNNPLFNDLLKNLRDWSQKGDKALVMLVPTPRYSDTLKKVIYSLLIHNDILAGQPQEQHAKTNSTIDSFLNHILTGDAQQGMLYGTSLLNKKQIKSFPTISVQTDSAKLLPSKPDTNQAITTDALPMVLQVNNGVNGNRYYLGRISDFTYGDIEENFFKNPIDPLIRTWLLTNAFRIITDIHAQQTKQKETMYQTLPHNLTAEFSLQEKKQVLGQNPKKTMQSSIAWLTPDDFFALDAEFSPGLTKDQRDERAKKNLTNGMKLLSNAGYGIAWFEIIPEWYLLKSGYRAHQKEIFLERMKKLADAINKTNNEKKTMAQFFLGANVTSNFRQLRVESPLYDIFGSQFSKIPSPLDFDHCWKEQFLDAIDSFMQATKEDRFAIEGIFIDLEMYHAQDQLAHYNDLHDFSDNAWQIFVKKSGKQEIAALTNVEQRVTYLRINKLFETYFAALEQAAEEIGQRIKQHIKEILPNAKIGVYLMTLPSSWFYRGLLRGLGTKQEPILCATFNTDYYRHHSWFEQQKIYIQHGAVCMLSKLQNKQDFSLICRLRMFNDFVWFNRPSRMLYEFSKDQIQKQYWALEASFLPLDQFIQESKSAQQCKD